MESSIVICSSLSGCIVEYESIISQGDAIGVNMSQHFVLLQTSLKGSNTYSRRHRRTDIIRQCRTDIIRHRCTDIIRHRRTDMIRYHRTDMIRHRRTDIIRHRCTDKCNIV